MLTVEELAGVPLFATLPESELQQLARRAADIRLAAGEYAAHEGDERCLYVVLAGKIEVTKRIDGVEKSIGWRTPGQVFGEVPLALSGVFLGNYRAAEPARVVRVSASAGFKAWPPKRPRPRRGFWDTGGMPPARSFASSWLATRSTSSG